MAKRQEAKNQAPVAEVPQPIPQSRVALYLYLGTLGCTVAEEQAQRYPETKDRILAIETAQPRKQGEAPVETPEWMIRLDNSDVGTLARSRRFTLLDDGLAPYLEYPLVVRNGASEVRLFSTIKFAEKVTQIRNRLRQLISVALEGANGRPLQIIITSSISGGTGSALIVAVALLARDEARRVSSGATVEVIVLGVLPSFFHASTEVQQTDRERLRLEANAAATLREIKFLQTPVNNQSLQRALGITPRAQGEVPPLTSLSLFGSESSGGTVSLEKMVERLVAAAITITHPGVAEFDRNQEGNAAAQYWGAFGRPEHAIVRADAVRAAWLPPATRDFYVQSLFTEAIASSVRKSETEQIDGLMLSLKARLGLNGIEVGIQQSIDEPTLSKKVTVEPRIDRMRCRDATNHLIGIHHYFKSEVMPPLQAKTRAKARELELTLIPEATKRVYDQILVESSGLYQAREVCEALVRALTEDGNNIAAKRGELKQADHSERFQMAIERLRKGSFVIGRSLRINAGKACDEWKRGKKNDLVLQLKERAFRLAAQRFQEYALEIGDCTARLRVRLGQANAVRDEARIASCKATDTLRSVIREDEVERFLQNVIQGIEVALGASKNLLSPSTLMQPGLDVLLADFVDHCSHRFGTFLRDHLRSLSGVAAFGRLRFELTEWVSEAAQKLTIPVPLNLLPIGGAGNASIHQYIAAGGEESRILSRFKGTNPKLRGFNIVDTGDPFFVAVRHRYSGLPFSCVPTADYESAAKVFESDDQTNSVNVLVSGGWVIESRHEALTDSVIEKRATEPGRDVERENSRSNGQPLPESLIAGS